MQRTGPPSLPSGELSSAAPPGTAGESTHGLETNPQAPGTGPGAGLAELKTRPEAEQEEILESIRLHGVGATREALRARNLETTALALSQFEAWKRGRKLLEDYAETSRLVMELIRRQNLEIGEDQIADLGFRLFEQQAICGRAPKVFAQLEAVRGRRKVAREGLRLRAEALRLQRAKFEFKAAEACLKALPALRRIASDPQLDRHQKIERARRRLFGTLPEEREQKK